MFVSFLLFFSNVQVIIFCCLVSGDITKAIQNGFIQLDTSKELKWLHDGGLDLAIEQNRRKYKDFDIWMDSGLFVEPNKLGKAIFMGQIDVQLAFKDASSRGLKDDTLPPKTAPSGSCATVVIIKDGVIYCGKS